MHQYKCHAANNRKIQVVNWKDTKDPLNVEILETRLFRLEEREGQQKSAQNEEEIHPAVPRSHNRGKNRQTCNGADRKGMKDDNPKARVTAHSSKLGDLFQTRARATESQFG